jgi:hypothetical protein
MHDIIYDVKHYTISYMISYIMYDIINIIMYDIIYIISDMI